MSQFIEYLKMAVSNIKANKMRSFLTMLGIIIGISSVILIMSLGNGARNVITEEMSGIAAEPLHCIRLMKPELITLPQMISKPLKMR